MLNLRIPIASRKLVPLRHPQSGVLLIELLIALMIIAILGLGITNSIWTVHAVEVVNRRSFSALQLANTKMEEVALTNPEALNANEPVTEVISHEGISYLRTTATTILPSRARRVKITVETVGAQERGGRAEIESSFALWGRR